MRARLLMFALLIVPGGVVASGRSPRLEGPHGAIENPRPTFSWTAVDNASDYHLWVVNRDGAKISELLSPATSCRGGKCTFASNRALSPGTYLWIVRSRIRGGRARWSPLKRFTVAADPLVAPKITLISPSGTLDTATPTFRWQAGGTGLQYELTVRGGKPRTFFRETYPAESLCDDQTCKAPPSLTNISLGDGKYRWHVRAIAARRGPKSDVLRFEVKTLPDPPSRPKAIAPSGRSSDPSPVFTWHASRRASGYEIRLRSQDGEKLFDKIPADASTCRDAICQFEPDTVTLEPGRYRWSVTATNSAGPSRPSRPLGFRVGDFLGTPEPLTPVGRADSNPVFSWTAVEGASIYFVHVRNDGERSTQRRFRAEDVCREKECETSLDLSLPKGTYRWRVAAKGNKPRGNPSRWVDFEVVEESGKPPGVARLLAPSGIVETKTPTFVWESVETATSYVLTVKDAFDPVLYSLEVPADKADCHGSCRVTPDHGLEDGDYAFSVRAMNEFGTGEPSRFKSFSVSTTVGTPPGSPRLVEPMGTVSTSTPEFIWLPVPGATSYQLVVEGVDAARDGRLEVDASTVCEERCIAQLGHPLDDGRYVYEVTAANENGSGPPSRAEFEVSTSSTLPPTTLLAPLGSTGTSDPEFRWSSVSEASSYTLNVQGSTSGFQFEQSYAPSGAGCGAECAVTPSLGLADGGYSFTVTTHDESGNSAVSLVGQFTVSTSASTLRITSHLDGDVIDDNGVVVSGTAQAGTTALTAELDIDGSIVMAARGVEVSPNNAWSVLIYPSELSPGAATLRLVATDSGGGSSSLWLSLTVTGFDPKGAALLSRATFGATPALIDELRTGGTAALEDRLLNPGPDPAFESLVSNLPVTTDDHVREYALFHALHNPNALEEVLAQFWDNHFSTDMGSHDVPDWELAENVAFRANALGRFRDMLEISAKSPAMLHYLDGVSNIAAEPNENYPRELLELYSMGVNGGYTQEDVEALARILTGWSEQNGVFVFNSDDHDFDEKMFLQQSFPSGVGLAEGERVLDMLAEHRSTAEFVCTKLAELFVSEEPTAALVDGCADVFQAEHLNGNPSQIREVVQYLFDSPDFVSLESYRDKVKTPLELVASTVRHLDATVADLDDLESDLGSDLEMRLFNNRPPDGFPEVADDWIDTGRLLGRVKFVNEIARETRERDTYVDLRAYFMDKGLETAEGIVGYLFAIGLANDFNDVDATIAFDILSLDQSSPFDINAPDASDRLRRLVGTVFSFPSYQHQ